MIEQIKLLSNIEEVQRLYDFVKQYPLDYPNYDVWLKKCKKQLEIGEKKAFYATNKDLIIGSIIFQKDKKEDLVLEVKNFRVADKHKGKGIGSALELILNSYGKSAGFKRIRIDTHHDNFDMIQFLTKKGFVFECEENLYVANKPEIIMFKDL